MAAAHVCFSLSSFAPLLHSALPVARNGGQSGRNRGLIRPSPVIYPGREPVSHELPDDFDFQVYIFTVQTYIDRNIRMYFECN